MSLPDGIQIRKAVQADRAVIGQMVRREHLNPVGLDWRRFLLATGPDGQVVGCVQIKHHGDGTRELASLVVDTAYRGCGLARKLIETIREDQSPPLYLMCRSTLEPLYILFGFYPLAAADMPGYYRRIYILIGFLRFFRPHSENLSIMRWE